MSARVAARVAKWPNTTSSCWRISAVRQEATPAPADEDTILATAAAAATHTTTRLTRGNVPVSAVWKLYGPPRDPFGARTNAVARWQTLSEEGGPMRKHG